VEAVQTQAEHLPLALTGGNREMSFVLGAAGLGGVGFDLPDHLIEGGVGGVHQANGNPHAVAGRHFQGELRLQVKRLNGFNRQGFLAQAARGRESVGVDQEAGDRVVQAELEGGLAVLVGPQTGVPEEGFGKVGPFAGLAVGPHFMGVHANHDKIVAHGHGSGKAAEAAQADGVGRFARRRARSREPPPARARKSPCETDAFGAAAWSNWASFANCCSPSGWSA
jgi:hypothetical protein